MCVYEVCLLCFSEHWGATTTKADRAGQKMLDADRPPQAPFPIPIPIPMPSTPIVWRQPLHANSHLQAMPAESSAEAAASAHSFILVALLLYLYQCELPANVLVCWCMGMSLIAPQTKVS